ncbi:MAG: protein kinase [Rubrivivax sp.]
MKLGAAELQQLSSLLDEALALPAPQRARWLQGLPAQAQPLAGTLRALLARHAELETGDFAALPGRLLAALPPAPVEPAAGRLVGPYRLLRELGQGGMGVVWLAERADALIERKVALKLPHVGWSPGFARRFARERAILATLEHAHIARLYDAGVDAFGRPYMALEYVEGETIDAWCARRALDLRARLALLLQVAEALAFAHARLVVHRDIKPGNVLVTVDGQVRLLDFGIAKLLEGEAADETELTRAAGRALRACEAMNRARVGPQKGPNLGAMRSRGWAPARLRNDEWALSGAPPVGQGCQRALRGVATLARAASPRCALRLAQRPLAPLRGRDS